jgi:hypothetical protein
LSPDEYRSALARLGLSVVGAGVFFGVNPRTSQRWASGEQDIPRAVQIALKLMLRYRVKPESLK